MFEQEYRDLMAQVISQRERAARFRALADHLDQQADRDERLLGELRAALGLDAQLRIDDLDRRLKGHALGEAALDILAREVGPGTPIHYKEWYRLLRAAGFQVGGKNPVATFLTQVQRVPEVERLGHRTGVYQMIVDAA
jgi:hypothetical protein